MYHHCTEKINKNNKTTNQAPSGSKGLLAISGEKEIDKNQKKSASNTNSDNKVRIPHVHQSDKDERSHSTGEKEGKSDDDDDEPFKPVLPRKKQTKQKHQFIRGTCSDNSNMGLKAIDRNAWIFVTRLHKDTMEQQVTSHLSKVCKDVKCTKLINLKNCNEVASFKICVPFDKKDEVLDGKIWPAGTLVNRYFFPRKNQVYNNQLKDVSVSEDFLDQTITEPTSK